MCDSKYFISFVIPVYNSERTLRRCVESLIEQTCNNFEAILVDDGSSDGSFSIMTSYAQEHSNITAYHLEHGGVSATRNYGVEKALGSYIAFIDADDFVEKDMVFELYSKTKNTNPDVVIFSIINDNAAGQPQWVFNSGNTRLNTLTNFTLQQLFYESGVRPYCFNKLYRTDLVKSIRFSHDLAIGEDHLFLINFFVHVKTCQYIDTKLYHYVMDNANSAMHVSAKNKEYMAQQHLILCNKGVEEVFKSSYRSSRKIKPMLTEWTLGVIINELLQLEPDNELIGELIRLLDSINLSNYFSLGLVNRKKIKLLRKCEKEVDFKRKRKIWIGLNKLNKKYYNFPSDKGFFNKSWFALFTLSYSNLGYMFVRRSYKKSTFGLQNNDISE